MSSVIVGIGHAHPATCISNEFFELLENGSDAAWVSDRTGILQRHSVLSKDQILAIARGDLSYEQLLREGQVPKLAQLARKPWEMALARAQEKNSGLEVAPDTLISGCSIPDFDIPASASTIAHELNFSSTCFDVNSACSSFCTDVMVASGLLQGGFAKQTAIFNIERYSLRLDYKDRRSSVLFGDGAAAAIFMRSTHKKLHGLKLIDVIMQSDASSFDAVTIPVAGYFGQNGAKVQKFAITKTVEIAQNLLHKQGLTTEDIQYFIGHQANLRMLQSVVEKLHLDPKKHLFNVDQFGNQGAAGAPIVLSQNWERFAVGERILIAVVGAGLTWGAALFEVV